MRALVKEDLKPGRRYRGKRPKKVGRAYDDREILWMGQLGVQYSVPAVAPQRHYHTVPYADFLAWAKGEVLTGESRTAAEESIPHGSPDELLAEWEVTAALAPASCVRFSLLRPEPLTHQVVVRTSAGVTHLLETWDGQDDADARGVLRRMIELALLPDAREYSWQELLERALYEWRVGYLVTNDGTAIQCLRCGRESHHPKDVEQKYCSMCKRFHEDFARA